MFEDHVQDISQALHRLPIWLQQHCLEIHREAIPRNTTYVIIYWEAAQLSARALFPPQRPGMPSDGVNISLLEDILFLKPEVN